MGIRDFSITANHPDLKYHPGQYVRGNIDFRLDSPKKVRGAYIKLKGVAKVSWIERTRHHGGKNSSTRYHGEDEYFDDKIYFHGKENGDTFELAPKDYKFEFNYKLPDRLPSSYEGTAGSIRYTIGLVLDIPFGFDDEEIVSFTVSSPVYLNTTPYLTKPQHRTAQTFLWCCCYRSGPLRVEINLPKAGFVNGEVIPVNVDVENQTSSNINFVNCEFQQRISFHSETPRHNVKDEDITLSSIRFEGLDAHSTKTFDEILTIPNVEMLNFTDCRLLEVSHQVKVTCDIAGLHRNFVVTIPVTLGSTQTVLPKQSGLPPFALSNLSTPYPYEPGHGDVGGNGSKHGNEKSMFE